MNKLRPEKFTILSIILFLIILQPENSLAQCTISLNGTYTIGGGVADFSSFTEAIDSLSVCGINGPVTINIAPGSGPYNEQITIPGIPGASAVNRITFDGNGETLQFNPTTNDRHLIRLDGAKHFNITNLNITGTSSEYGYGIHFMNQADSNHIINCTIDLSSITGTSTSGSAGIAFSASTVSLTTPLAKGNTGSHNLIENNIIIGAYTGIRIFGATSTKAESNIISGNIIRDFYSYGIYLNDVRNCIAIQNDISRPNRFSVGTFYAIYLTGGNEMHYLAKNRIHSTHDNASFLAGSAYAFYFSNASAPTGMENYVVNNLIYDFNSNGTIRALFNSGSDGAYYYHNTISLDNMDATGFTTTSGFYQTVQVSNIDFRNNIISITRGGTGAKHALYLSDTNSVVLSDYNTFNILQDSMLDNHIGYFGANQTTLADWQFVNNNSFGQNSIIADPAFTDIAGNDYTPLNTAINNIATPLGIYEDINLTARDSLFPDPGAIEFTPVQFDAGITALIQPEENICGSENLEVRIEITNFGFDALSNVLVTTIVSGPVSDTLTATSGLIPILNSDTIYLGSFNFSNGGYVTLLTYISAPGDLTRFNDTLISVVYINTTPGIIEAYPYRDSICAGLTETIEIISDSSLIYTWYDAVAGGNTLAQGPTYNTPALNSSISYFAEAVAEIKGTIGKSFPSENASIYVDGWGLVFNALDQITIDSVHVYPQSIGILTLQIVDNSGAPISDSVSFTFTSGDIDNKTALYLGFSLNPGNGYQLITLPSSTVTGMRRDNSGNSFPYTIHNTIQIIGSYNGAITPAVYYWFYDWKITYLGCPSARTEFPIFVDTINASVSASFSYSGSGSGLEIDFIPNDTSNINSYLWQFGDGESSVLSNTNHTYHEDGSYTACLAVSNVCNQDSACQTFTICKNLSSSFSYLTDSLTTAYSFNGDGNPTAYLWYFGDDSTSTLANPLHTYSTDGLYNVELIIENLCGEIDTTSMSIAACALLKSDFSFEKGNDGLTFTLSNQTSGKPSEYLWTFGDGNTDTTANPVTTYVEFGNYDIALNVTNICGAVDSITYAVNACLTNTASFSYTEQNDHFTFEFDNTSAGSNLTYLWNFGDGDTSSDLKPVNTYDNFGNYFISLITTDACGFTDTATASIKIAVGIAGTGQLDNLISIYPNPNDGRFTLSLLLNKEHEVQLRIRDILGKIVMVNSARLNHGKHDLHIQIMNQTKGLYLLDYTIGNQTGFKKIVVN